MALVSTVDVYPDPIGWDEGHQPAAGGSPYGAHRLAVEEHIRDQFPHAQVMRLPALVGPGLKKNAVFDLLTGNDPEKVNPAGTFQWYDVRRVWTDLMTAEAAELRTVNLVTAPVSMAEVAAVCFQGHQLGPQPGPAPTYSLTTRHAAVFGGTASDVFLPLSGLSLVAGFVAEVRRGEVVCGSQYR